MKKKKGCWRTLNAILKMSDKEFWESTPAKIFALLDDHSKVENPQNLDKKKKLDNESLPKMTPEIFKQWSR